jgi:hypothetical protein
LSDFLLIKTSRPAPPAFMAISPPKSFKALSGNPLKDGPDILKFGVCGDKNRLGKKLVRYLPRLRAPVI